MVILSLGASKPGTFGPPAVTLRIATETLSTILNEPDVSPTYVTQPLGARSRRLFLNLVVVGEPRISPRATLQFIHRLEWHAGRRPGPRWTDRPLDIDIIDWRRMRLNWPGNRPAAITGRGARLTLPHPAAHARAFVLRPLADVIDNWRHPITDRHIRSLLRDNALDASRMTLATEPPGGPGTAC